MKKVLLGIVAAELVVIACIIGLWLVRGGRRADPKVQHSVALAGTEDEGKDSKAPSSSDALDKEEEEGKGDLQPAAGKNGSDGDDADNGGSGTEREGDKASAAGENDQKPNVSEGEGKADTPEGKPSGGDMSEAGTDSDTDKKEQKTLIAIYRLRNAERGSYLFAPEAEKDAVLASGEVFVLEGVAWYAPVEGAQGVTRLRNRETGDYVYTCDLHQIRTLTEGDASFVEEGIQFYSDPDMEVAVYSFCTPRGEGAEAGQEALVDALSEDMPEADGAGDSGTSARTVHLYTADPAEIAQLSSDPEWENEGPAFYGSYPPENL